MEKKNTMYNVGDVVKVRADLSEEHGATETMARKWAGKEVTINSTTVDTFLGRMPFYSIVEDKGYAWNDDMFESAVKSTKTDKMPELTTGMFGIADDGDCFVVVGRTLVYQGGLLDRLDDIVDPANWIDALYECECFDDIDDGIAKVIWERPKSEGQTPAQTEEEKEADANLEEVKENFRKAAKVLMELLGGDEQ